MSVETIDDAKQGPAERRRRKVRDAIITAAEQIFTEDGPEGLSMRKIAERIDYSPAAIYKYFESKEALVRAIRELFFERMLKRFQDVTGQIEDGPALYLDCMRAYIDTGLEQPGHYKLAFDGYFTEPEEGGFAIAASDHLEAIISHGIDQGWIRDVNLNEASHSVWASVHGLTILAITLPNYPKSFPDCEDLELSDIIRFHGELIMRGLGTAKMIARLDSDLKSTC